MGTPSAAGIKGPCLMSHAPYARQHAKGAGDD